MDDRFMLKLNFRTADGKPIPDGVCTVNLKKDGIIWRELKSTTENGVWAGIFELPNPSGMLSWECAFAAARKGDLSLV